MPKENKGKNRNSSITACGNVKSGESSEADDLGIVVGVQIDTLDKAIMAIAHHQSLVSAWKVKYPESMSEFALAVSNIDKILLFLRSFKIEHTQLLVEVNFLKSSLYDLKLKHLHLEYRLLRETVMREQLEKKIDDLKKASDADRQNAQLESDKQKSIIRAFDLIKMYQHYIVEPIVLNTFRGPWGRFCEKYYEMEEDVFNGLLTQSDFDNFLRPYDDQLVGGMTILKIMKTSDDRHAIAHHDIRSSSKQKAFLNECASVAFVDPASSFIASSILPELAKVSLHRIMNE
jgi:hypothetical protein